jgi:RNA polymerase sigma-70 factor (ECF subfamily)
VGEGGLGVSCHWPGGGLFRNLIPVSAPDEAQLLSRCLRGDERAWDELFDRHYTPATRFVFQLGYDFVQEDVEEICQEVFLTVIKSLHTFQGQSQFQTWLFRIAANRARDYRQRQHAAKRGGGRQPLSLHVESDDERPLDPPSPLPTPDAVLLDAEQAALVGQALEQLGGPCQEIIELRYFADLSYEEISASLRLNPKTVSSRLSKCLDKLESVARVLVARAARPVPTGASTAAQGQNQRETKTHSSV